MINSTKKITENRIIMDHTVEFMTNYSEKIRKQELRDLNSVQSAKRLHLPLELVGTDGKEITNTYANNKELLAIE